MQISASDIKAYIQAIYPAIYRDNLNAIRLDRLVYFADWLHQLHHGHSMTGSDWYATPYGPFSNALEDSSDGDAGRLGETQRQTLDRLVRKTAMTSAQHFNRTLLGTMPMLASREGEWMDFASLADEWHRARDRSRAVAGNSK